MGTSISTINPNFRQKYKRKPVLILLEKNPAIKLLLVEGDSDDFYGRFLNQSVTLFPVTDSKEYGECYFSPNIQRLAKEYVKELVKRALKRESENTAIKYGKCYGLIDKDYDCIREDLESKYNNRLECTDYNDLETTLIYLDYDNIESKFIKDFNSDNDSFNILRTSIDYASQIGKLRRYREDKGSLLKNVKINFKKKEEDSDGYFSFLENDNFNIEKFIADIGKPNAQKLINAINQYKGNNLLYCRGHDIFDFITSFYKKKNKVRKEYKKYSVGDNKVLDMRKHYEAQMESYFNEEKLKETNIYTFISMINNS